MPVSISSRRVSRAVALGIVASAGLYAMLLSWAEPMRGLAAADSENVVVSLTVVDDISITCSTPVSLGTITRTGDSSVNLCGADGFCRFAKTKCVVSTNDSDGYALAWRVTTGTGAAGARTGTGHLNGYTAGNRIKAYTPATAGVPEDISVTNDARWAGRLSSSGTTTTGGGSMTWGADGTTDTWLNVGTGSQVTIASRGTATTGAGDEEYIGFRAIIHGTAIVPTDVYKATVVFTATTN
jgi:hypothetical protein